VVLRVCTGLPVAGGALLTHAARGRGADGAQRQLAVAGDPTPVADTLVVYKTALARQGGPHQAALRRHRVPERRCA